ncbi:MAG: FAD-dependent oxidoreductase [Flavobacteriaceae bacterium CG_4_8_14_3_um_filter_34_10]|nr:MAG: FAD-dependent oxidoreductase [Flavobacteriaceae bacterium CG18_big_fil_WC_8_21_14_2_50_34_36]PIV49542.1 MAG: FAD-dependent oxidoreductase [Flavobacteriaceae bacterium CG02_land_8_20_14_3_00_34_13]PIX09481.1 MAG: FAD-dependent oxidoreductase [Flavobacteriaceae bacterium CG_4_8_14_3_um_filter_34_10]PIZ07523.1 MAG: FAD-dependent oxidoreductase [Flavobacteriaceae bacterium CG_4_10_14_0_8_um_filter_34_31]PJC07177.1 MAG: FAD-dependent oxidoreductase [Flavobacteriaceae bacterium CG_4_9_14_0_8_
MEHIVIIGNGIAGVTAARHIRKLSDKKITIISAESDYFFSRTALMYVYMGHMKFEHIQPYENWFWKKNRIELKNAWVSKVSPEENLITFSSGETMSYDKLIIATGSKPNKFGWPGQDLKGVQGLYSKQDLEMLEENAPNNEVCKRAVIVGGGLIGVEMAEMLTTRKIPVTFLVREKNFWGNVLPENDAKLIGKHILEHHIDLRLGVNLKEILSDENGRVKGIIVAETEEEIACTVVGLTAGVSPNIDFLKDSGIAIGRGVLVNRNLETNFKNMYAIGDCAEQQEPTGERRPIEAVWYTSRMMGEVVAQTICGNSMHYNPGHWFNSAKFFDIEYQTYGWVFAKPRNGEAHFHWQHADAKKGITINYQEESRKFIGINTFGIRLKHEVFDRWLTEGKTVDYVIEHFQEANFDPEFFKTYENEIAQQFHQKQNITI